MISVPLSRLPAPTHPTRPRQAGLPTEGNKAATLPQESFQGTKPAGADFKLIVVKRGLKGRLVNAARLSGTMVGYFAGATAIGATGLLLAPAAITAYVGLKVAKHGVLQNTSLEEKALVATGAVALTAVIAASLTVCAIPALLLANTGIPTLLSAGLTGAAIGALQERLPKSICLEKRTPDSGPSEVFTKVKSDSKLVFGAKLSVPKELFEVNEKNGTAESSHNLVLIPKEQLAKAKELGGVKPEMGEAKVTGEQHHGLRLDARIDSTSGKGSSKNVTLAALVEVPKNIVPDAGKVGFHESPYEFVMMPEGTEKYSENFGGIPVKVERGMLNQGKSALSLDILAVYDD